MEKKSPWVNKHGDAFSSAISRAAEQFMNDVTEESVRREKALSDQIREFVSGAANAEALEQENKALKAQLAVALAANSTLTKKEQPVSEPPKASGSDAVPSSPQSDVTVPTQLATVPYIDYANLTRKYDRLRQERDNFETAHGIILRKWRSNKEHIRAWNKEITEFRAQRAAEKLEARERLRREHNGMLTPVTANKATPSRPNTLEGIPSPGPLPPLLSPDPEPHMLPTSETNPHGMSRDDAPEAAVIVSRGPTSDLSSGLLNRNMSNEPEHHENGQEFQLVGAKSPAEGDGHTTSEPPFAPDEPVVEEDELPALPTNRYLEAVAADHPSCVMSDKTISSDATQDLAPEAENGNQAQGPTTHSDSDVPVVVSTRSLKRRKREPLGNGDQTANIRDGTPAKPVRIKDELTSSPAFKPKELQPLTQTSTRATLDLDEIGHQIGTPRKRRRLEEMIRSSQFRATALSSLRNERSFSLPAEAQLKATEYPGSQDEEDSAVVERVIPSLRHHDSDPVKLEEHVESSLFQQTPGRKRPRRALSPRSTNSRILPRTIDRNSPKRQKRGDDEHGAAAVPTIAEDGENETSSSTHTPVQKKANSKNRLLDLLQGGHTPASEPLTSLLTPARSIKPSRGRNTPQISESTTATISSSSSKFRMPPAFEEDMTPTAALKSRRAPRRRSPSLNRQNGSRPSTPRSEFEPLRVRPVKRLSREDFIVNPLYNQGLDYAFQDTVRKVADRRCLPGCTRPDCCGGHFRRLIEISGLKPTIERKLWDPPCSPGSTEEREEEERVLKYFLGAAYDRAKTEKMTKAERKETLIQARAKLLADRSGKHRQVGQRRKTPPLFWETGMPSTQEFEEQRRQADEDERMEVEKRWFDAMREGGYWKFRDE